ncbi:MAG: hypothetical protein IBJ09_12975 [Bacteroidia bacterium]|nr:hypothetical protein [Bacteroidia bacterium]
MSHNSFEPGNTAPDFSETDSLEKAQQLYAQNVLAKLYLMPLNFGGQDAPHNILYVLPVVTELKARFDTMVEELLEQDKELSYSAEPEYKGRSFIPSKLHMRVRGDAELSQSINIW